MWSLKQYAEVLLYLAAMYGSVSALSLCQTKLLVLQDVLTYYEAIDGCDLDTDYIRGGRG